VIGDYTGESKIVFIGEAPGTDEDKEGVPFVGRSGMILRKELETFPSHLYSIINAVKCHPPDNETPTQEQIEQCRWFMMRQLEYLRPTHIVVLGATAYHALFFHDARPIMSKLVGRIRQKYVKNLGTVEVIVNPIYLP